tara:strand:+ start:464 stop:1282 length:819 start_codon:yes stop_codon:yes gene_type:complete
MQCILSALKSESQPFIDYYKLQRDNNFRFPVFRNKDFYLIAIGVGKKHIKYRLKHFFQNVKQRPIQFINIGVAGGHKALHSLGDVFLINKINDKNTNNSYFPDILYKHSSKEIEITTVQKEITNGGEDFKGLVDMESAEIFRVCSKFSPIHDIAFIKVVSDFMDGEIKNYDKEHFSNLIKNNLKEISSLINSLRLIENINPNILNSNDEKWLKQVTIRLRLTKSQSIILKKYLKGNKIRNLENFYPLIPEFDHNSKLERNKLFQNILAELTT